MPINSITGLFSRAWRFVDRFAQGDDITRADLDQMADDLATGVNAALSNQLFFVGDWIAGSAFPTQRPDGKPVRARDTWRVSVAGTVGGVAFDVDDYLLALVPSPGSLYANNWLKVPSLLLPQVLALVDQAELARDDAETARTGAQSERAGAQSERTAAQAARTGAEAAAAAAAASAATINLPSFTGNAGRFLRANTGGTALEFAENFTLDAAGNLLVGTITNPDSAKVHIVGGGITHSGSQLNARAGTGNQYEFVNRNGAGFDFYVNNAGTLAARIDSNGNLGLGVTPSAWDSWRALEIGLAGNALTSNNVNSLGLISNAVLTATGWRYGANGYANFMAVGNAAGQYAWFTAPSGTAGNPITFTQAMTLDAAGNLGIGTSSPAYRLHVNGRISYSGAIGEGADTTLSSSGTNLLLGESATWTTLRLYTGGTERARIDANGRLLVGSSSPSLASGFVWDGTGETGTTPIVKLAILENGKHNISNPGQWRFYTSSGNNSTFKQGFNLSIRNYDVGSDTESGDLLNLSGNGNLFVAGRINGAIIANDAGQIGWFAMSTPPTGWLKANGAAVSRTTYAALFAAIGTTYGAGDGSTTFHLPDLRGEFLRSWDDGRGVDSGRGFGTAQSSQNLWHGHSFSGWTDTQGAHTHTFEAFFNQVNGGGGGSFPGGIGNSTSNDMAPAWAATATNARAASAGAHSHNVGGSIGGEGGGEARPRNVALLACIKF